MPIILAASVRFQSSAAPSIAVNTDLVTYSDESPVLWLFGTLIVVDFPIENHHLSDLFRMILVSYPTQGAQPTPMANPHGQPIPSPSSSLLQHTSRQRAPGATRKLCMATDVGQRHAAVGHGPGFNQRPGGHGLETPLVHLVEQTWNFPQKDGCSQ